MGGADIGNMSLTLDTPIPDLTNQQLVDAANALTRAAGLATTLQVVGIVQPGGVLVLRVPHHAVDDVHGLAERFNDRGITIVVIAPKVEADTAPAASALAELAAENRQLRERLAELEDDLHVEVCGIPGCTDHACQDSPA